MNRFTRRIVNSAACVMLGYGLIGGLCAQRASAAPPADSPKPLAVEEMDNGIRIEILRVQRTSDGFTEVRWQYVNPSNKPIILWHAGGGQQMLNALYLVDPAARTKHGVVVMEKDKFNLGAHTMLAPTMIWGQTEIAPGGSFPAWAKFEVPAETKRVNFVHPGNMPPMDNLAIAPADGDSSRVEGRPLASLPHLYPPDLVLEVTRARKTSDGFFEVRWRYVNPTQKPIILWYAGGGKILVDGLFIVDAATHAFARVARDQEGVAYAADAGQTEIAPGESFGFWARFSLPKGAKLVTLYGLGAHPVEDLPVRGGDEKPEAGNEKDSKDAPAR